MSTNTTNFPWDNTDKDSLEQLQALLKETGREVTLQELQKMKRKVIYETDPRLDLNFESSEGETA